MLRIKCTNGLEMAERIFIQRRKRHGDPCAFFSKQIKETIVTPKRVILLLNHIYFREKI